jgi:hypothetical protein
MYFISTYRTQLFQGLTKIEDGESFLLRFVAKSVSWDFISMFFISTYSTQLFQGSIKI